MSHRIGLVQMNSSADFDHNCAQALKKIQEASEQGLSLVAFPEMFLWVGEQREKKFEIAQNLEGAIVTHFQEVAQKFNISVLLGSLYETTPEHPNHLYNTSILLNRQGEIQGIYRKLHLCDIDSPALKNLESRDIKSGNESVVLEHEIGCLGLSICYDLRFPSLYQHLTAQGAQIIFVPSAFFLHTGKSHWIPLLQARAIENQVYIAAPAQWGNHYGNRYSYGHSVLIDPWGTIVACASERAEMITGTIDLEYLHEVRDRMPVLDHRRPECY